MSRDKRVAWNNKTFARGRQGAGQGKGRTNNAATHQWRAAHHGWPKWPYPERSWGPCPTEHTPSHYPQEAAERAKEGRTGELRVIDVPRLPRSMRVLSQPHPCQHFQRVPQATPAAHRLATPWHEPVGLEC